MLQLTTRTKHRLAIEPAHVAAVEELPGNTEVGTPELTLRTRLHMSGGVTHDVIEAFEGVFNDWTAESGADDPDDDALDAIAEAQARIRDLPLPASVADTPDMNAAFEAFKGAVIEALADI